ncbi:MAG: hypothetical protein IJP23_05020 [Oscillospiraceae bacterium]|nr:hypothetical protein [Oscillospiraceae bacterium]
MEYKTNYFFGANSGAGFYPLTDYVVDFANLNRVYLLKGGAGCGKSTFMKKVAAAAEAAGERVEYYRCSSDPDSLDAIKIPGRKAVIADATPPHGGAAVTLFRKIPRGRGRNRSGR